MDVSNLNYYLYAINLTSPYMLQMGCFSITWKFLAILYALMAGGLGIALVSSAIEAAAQP